MGYYRKESKDYTIHRYTWWKFWQVDTLEFTLPTRYEEAYEEVERKTMGSTFYSIELMDWVKDDVRQQLSIMVITYDKLVRKAKKLSVKFHTKENAQYFIDGMDFYVRGDIYFDSDESIKREKLLDKLGI